MDWLERFIQEHTIIVGAVMAFFTSFVRLWRSSNGFMDKILDSLLCSSMTVGIFYTITFFKPCPDTLAIAIGSFVGYLGTEKVKEIILKKFTTEDKKNNEDK